MSFVSKVLAEADPLATIQVEQPQGFFLDFGEMISKVLNIILIIAVILVLFYLILGGISWLTSGGDKGKTESARNQITAAVVGLIIIVSSWAIMLFVQNILGLSIFGRAGQLGN